MYDKLYSLESNKYFRFFKNIRKVALIYLHYYRRRGIDTDMAAIMQEYGKLELREAA